ncbi:MAG: redoxin family protein, partial [Brumimicrobium sp.]
SIQLLITNIFSMSNFKIFSSLLVVSLLIFSFQKDENKIKTLKVGEEAPMQGYKMKSTSNNEETLKTLSKEKGIIVVFSCNTCPFVIGNDSFEGWERDYNKLNTLANQIGLGFVLVNSNEAKRKKGDGFKDMVKRVKDFEYTMPYLLDKNHELADAFGAKTTPHIFMLDNNMKLIYEGAIDNTWNPSENKIKPYLVNAMNAYAEGEEIEINKTAPKGCSIKRK